MLPTEVVKKATIVLLVILLGLCCKESFESDRFLLSEDEKSFIPYQINDKVGFIHSGGFRFDLTATNIITELQRTNTEHCGEPYITYETKTVALQSGTPQFDISVAVFPKEFSPYFTININRYYFQKELTEPPDYDTLTLNGRLFKDVYKMEIQYGDTSLIIPQQVLYNCTNGLLQIKMTNDETFTIDQ